MEQQAATIRYILAWQEQTLGDPHLQGNMEPFDKECERIDSELADAEKMYDSFLSGQAEVEDEGE
jgi:hypothetical protein